MALLLITTMIALAGCGAEWERATTEAPEPNLPEADSVGAVTDYTPVALSDLAEDPQGYVEQGVIVDGQFGAPVSAQSFTITDPTEAFGNIRFLVVGANESAIPDVDIFDVGDLPLIQVRGVLRLLDPALIEDVPDLNTNDSLLQEYDGKPIIIAHEVQILETPNGE
jgi:hypothetical protein